MNRRSRVSLVVVLVFGLGACSGDAADVTASTTTTTPPTSTTTTAAPTTTSQAEPADHPAAGIWLVDLGVAHLQFRLESGPDGSVIGVFDSPAEGAADIPIEVDVDGETVTIEIPIASASFEGTVSGDTFDGIWRQSGQEVPMTFERQTEAFAYPRPQEPQPPFPYRTTDVVFPNGDFELAGTLVVPEGDGPFPTVVFVSGSGSQDRNETIMGHKPFLVLADAMARRGIASLRYDDRGVFESGGDPTGATTEELATDAAAAARFVREQPEVGSVGIVGHSEGGLIAPLVAGEEGVLDFIVMLAGPGLPGADVLSRQTIDLMRADGAPESVIEWRSGWSAEVYAVAASGLAADAAADEIRQIVESANADAPAIAQTLDPNTVDATVEAFTDPWMRWFLAHDPAPALRRVGVPVLALIGELDLQVAAEANLPAITAALAGNPDATVAEVPGVNHLFQHAASGAVSEYATIAETFAPEVMDQIADWINERF